LLEREPEHLAHLSQGRFAAIADHLAHHRRAVTAIAPIDFLNDLLSTFVLEVDVDVGRLAPLVREEALEEERRSRRVDRRDAETITNGAVGRAAAPLTQDLLLARDVHDLPNAQEVRGHLELRDEGELLLEKITHVIRDFAVAAPRALVGLLAQE
jgi:hypothetical protein